jgi:ABC-type phosphate/phosphonate transport system substrate-binding protein
MTLSTTRMRLSRRTLIGGAAAAAVCAMPLGWAQQALGWRLLVNEAFTADLSISMLALRYRGWADYMGAQIHNRQVMVDPIIDVQRFVQQAVSDQKPLLVFGKSVNQIAKLVRDHGYQPLVRRPEPYKAAFIVARDSPIQGMSQLGGRRLLMPDAHSATAAVARAEIRYQGIREPFISHTRFQDSVSGQISSGMAEAGVVNPTIAKKWRDGGGRVIGETQPVVNWSVLASPKASPDMVARLTESLLAMNGPASGGLLSEIGVKQWARADRKEYLALLEYTGE